MLHRIPAVFALALLGACSTSTPAPEVTPAPAPEVIPLSKAAVEVPTTQPVSAAVPLSEAIKADAVAVSSGANVAAAPEVVAAPVVTHTFTLRHGETLDHFAKWAELPVEDIAEQSGLDLAGDYPVGTQVVVPIDGDRLTALEVRRDEHWRRRIDGYLASRGGSLGIDSYAVRTGDTAWSISKERVGVPIWVLAAYNPEVSLDTLRPGQKLMVPLLADTIVDAAPLSE